MHFIRWWILYCESLHQPVQALRCTAALPSKSAPQPHHGIGIKFAIVKQLSLDLGLSCGCGLGRNSFDKGAHRHAAVLYAVEFVVM